MHVLMAMLLGVLISASASAAETYRWQDANGHTHYGDEPPEDAQQLRQVRTYECKTEKCRAEMKQRYEDAIAANKDLDEWLREREAARQALRRSASESRSSSIYITSPLIVPTVPAFGPLIDNPFAGSLPRLKHPNHHRAPKIRRSRVRFAR
jgi:hypothetical protein